jgi:hypothetical protein
LFALEGVFDLLHDTQADLVMRKRDLLELIETQLGPQLHLFEWIVGIDRFGQVQEALVCDKVAREIDLDESTVVQKSSRKGSRSLVANHVGRDVENAQCPVCFEGSGEVHHVSVDEVGCKVAKHPSSVPLDRQLHEAFVGGESV